jgi:hypothetical protein
MDASVTPAVEAADILNMPQRVIGNSTDALRAISFHSLFRSIISAAVSGWVSEHDIRESIITDCPLRHMMLSHLTTMGQLHLMYVETTVLIMC